MIVLARLFRAYRRSKYLPLHEVKGQAWEDLVNLMDYLWLTAGWKVHKDAAWMTGEEDEGVDNSDE